MVKLKKLICVASNKIIVIVRERVIQVVLFSAEWILTVHQNVYDKIPSLFLLRIHALHIKKGK
jgi:hypothetical protein